MGHTEIQSDRLRAWKGKGWQKHSFFVLLRYALHISEELPQSISTTEWGEIYTIAQEQNVMGVLFAAIRRMPAALQPPHALYLMWYAEAERIAQANEFANEEAKRWTEVFAGMGARTCVLKGQGNALLYTEDGIRTPGDLDIYVEGGQERVMQLLEGLHLEGRVCEHHFHVDEKGGIPVEVHFKASQGSLNPRFNRRVQKWMMDELRTTVSAKDFYIPTPRFNRVMQLSHMQHHFVADGVSLRQLIDYYFVLKSEKCPDMEQEMKWLGLNHFGQAVMHVMRTVFWLDKEHLPVHPNRQRGKVLLDAVMQKGSFGKYHAVSFDDWPFIARNIRHTLVLIYYCWLFPNEYSIIWSNYWKNFYKKHHVRRA